MNEIIRIKASSPGFGSLNHLRAHVVDEAEGQVLLDALHAVVVLPPGGTEVLLQGPGHGGKHRQSCLVHVHDVGRRRLLVLLLHPSYVCEGLLHGDHQPGTRVKT